MDKTRRLPRKALLFAAAVLVIVCGACFLLLRNKKTYTAADFGIETVYSAVDFDGDGVDDYTDFLLGAKADAANKPRYDGAYVAGGYPPEDVGVCTDVIWRAFREAGYSLKDMVDADIAAHPEDYPTVEKPDPNIDFRRVKTLRSFFEKYAVRLTEDKDAIAEWQPGDIVIFGKDQHIGMVSDLRNRKGHTYILHNGGQKEREEDYLNKSFALPVTGHYRFVGGSVH